jgi:hypothetical protein
VTADVITAGQARADDLLSACPIFGRGHGVVSDIAPDPGSYSSDHIAAAARAGVFLPNRVFTRSLFRAGSPMTDVAYLCHNCGSVHEVESIRENLVLDLRTAASYELPGQRGVLNPRVRFLRWRMARGLARALWPRYSDHPAVARSLRLVQGQSVAVPDRPVPCRATNGRHRCAGRLSGSSRYP